jgi:hypothetical protein
VITTCDECTPPGFARDGWIEGRLQDLLVLPGTHTFFSNRIRRSYDKKVVPDTAPRDVKDSLQSVLFCSKNAVGLWG